ncbi:MAG: hypothetical protein CM1200mP35_09630 [Chloroflexota bacterium]|nr:MAG: hypothetical protein CM1200mP35_09630 [Chloroflexota bacterium]
MVLKEAQSRFDKYIEDPGSLHPDLRGLSTVCVPKTEVEKHMTNYGT